MLVINITESSKAPDPVNPFLKGRNYNNTGIQHTKREFNYFLLLNSYIMFHNLFAKNDEFSGQSEMTVPERNGQHKNRSRTVGNRHKISTGQVFGSFFVKKNDPPLRWSPSVGRGFWFFSRQKERLSLRWSRFFVLFSSKRTTTPLW